MTIAKDCLVAAGTFIFLSHIFYRIIWFIRLATLAHWCCLMGNYTYPENPFTSYKYGAIFFVSLLVAVFIPSIYCPPLRNISTILSLLPQLHLLLLLHDVHCNIHRRSSAILQPLMKTLNLYTAVSLVSVVWTVINVMKT